MYLIELFPERLNRIAMFMYFNSTIFLNNTGITAFDINADIFLTTAILIVGNTSFSLKVRHY